MLSDEEIARITIAQTHKPYAEAFMETLTDPDDCLCTVLGLQLSHQELNMNIYSPATQEKYRVRFRAVEYFEGAMRWRGARFRISTFEESMELLEQVASNRGGTAKDYFYQGCLFNIGTNEKTVARILAWTFEAGKLEK